MANFPGLLMKAGTVYRVSGGCREQAFPSSGGASHRTRIDAIESYLSCHGSQFRFLREFIELTEKFKFVSRMHDNDTARKRVQTLLENCGVKDFAIGKYNWAFDTKAKGAVMFAYILHATGRDFTESPVSEKYPAPLVQFTSPTGISSGSRDLVAAAFGAWVDAGMPNVKSFPRDHHVLTFAAREGKLLAPVKDAWFNVRIKKDGKKTRIDGNDSIGCFSLSVDGEVDERFVSNCTVQARISNGEMRLTSNTGHPKYTKFESTIKAVESVYSSVHGGWG